MHIRSRSLLALLAAGLLVGAAGYQGITLTSRVAAAPSGAAITPVKIVKSAKLGRILANARGRTLYHFKLDRKNVSNCAGQCAQFWPPLLVGKSARLSKKGLPGKLGTTSRAGGGRQVTYNGWPLYVYSGDKHAGDVTGQGIQGLWFAATPKMAAAIPFVPPSPTPTATSTVTPTAISTATSTAVVTNTATATATGTARPTATSTLPPLPTSTVYVNPYPTPTRYAYPYPTLTPYPYP